MVSSSVHMWSSWQPLTVLTASSSSVLVVLIVKLILVFRMQQDGDDLRFSARILTKNMKLDDDVDLEQVRGEEIMRAVRKERERGVYMYMHVHV